jgi:hypothetical protein
MSVLKVRVFSEVISMAIPGPGKVEYLPPAGWNTQVSGKGRDGNFTDVSPPLERC